MNFDNLMKLMGRLDVEGKERFGVALSSFFGELFSPEEFLEKESLDLDAFEDAVGADIFRPLFMSAVEFFLSNEYPDTFTSWNAIDFLLKKRGVLFSAEDAIYLKGLRNSYMSLYEVVDVQLDKGLIVRDLLDEKLPPLFIREKRGTHYICQWDLLGGRVVRTPSDNLFAGGFLPLSRESASEAKGVIQRITSVMTSKENLALFQGTTKDPILLIKKMWTKEISQIWFTERLKRKQPMTLLNYERDPLQFYTLEFPLKKPVAEIVKLLDGLPQLFSRDLEGIRYAWIWPLQEEGETRLPKKQDHGNVQILDTVLTDENGKTCRYRAELKIEGQKLIVDVNSEKRANDMEEFLQTHLASLIEAPSRILHELSPKKNRKSTSKGSSSGLSLKEEEKLMAQFFEQHYRGWLDSPLPSLKGKSPRQAIKTKTGREKVINLLKDFVNAELRSVKQGIKKEPYNFDWMFTELGAEKHLL